MKFIRTITIILFFTPISGWATHNRGGEITFEQTGPLKYKITVTTYTKSSAQADRPILSIKWGDNTSDSISRSAITPLPGGVDIQRNDYFAEHVYPAQGTYTVSIEDQNRNQGVKNIPNSINVPMYLESKLTINPFLVPNRSVRLLYPPIDFGCVNKLFIHNPNAYDPDGDSLSFELVSCRGQNGAPINGYVFSPTCPGVQPLLSIDNKTGQLVWDRPCEQGEFNFAILIREWRSGQEISSVLRDLQVDISVCNNDPPDIAIQNDTCVKAGSILYKTIVATDQNNDLISLSAFGGPLEVSTNKATFAQSVNNRGRAEGDFRWQTDCSHIRQTPYQVLFRAQDRPNTGQISLSDLEYWNISVIPIPPVLLTAVSLGGEITLTWDNAAVCPDARGYYIYRKQGGASGFVPKICETGVPASSGYQLIDFVKDWSTTVYVDNDKGAGLASGVEYCYIVTSVYGLDANAQVNRIESCASNELCEIVKRDLPVITLVDVEQTGVSNGKINLAWQSATQLDTLQFPGPYKYEIYRSDGLSNQSLTRSLITTYTVNNFYELNNFTNLQDTGINTVNSAKTYQIDFFYSQNNKIGFSSAASSVFLQITPQPSSLLLSWDYKVPWTNDTFFVYRRDNGVFGIIDTVYDQKTYVDKPLVDGLSYCYYIKSAGGFNQTSGLPVLIYNRSQEVCESPRDTVPPCAPSLLVTPDCNLFQNTLAWKIADSSCVADLAFYRIYYKPLQEDELARLAVVNKSDSTYRHELSRVSIAGCYAITAVDSFGNESLLSNTVCVDNCPDYKLPNIITPNGDNKNDVLRAFDSYKFIDHIDLIIYNRWGQKVYGTTDSDFTWNGTDELTGQPLVSGTYYYLLTVYENSLNGVVEKPTVKGIVRILRP